MYRWVHYALCDYYAARYIYIEGKKNAPSILAGICKSERIKDYVNVLKMYAEMDVNGFYLFVAKPVIDACVAKGLKENIDISSSSKEEVDNVICIMDLLYEVIPSIFSKKGVLDLDKALHFSSGLTNKSVGDSISDIIKGL